MLFMNGARVETVGTPPPFRKLTKSPTSLPAYWFWFRPSFNRLLAMNGVMSLTANWLPFAPSTLKNPVNVVLIALIAVCCAVEAGITVVMRFVLVVPPAVVVDVMVNAPVLVL